MRLRARHSPPAMTTAAATAAGLDRGLASQQLQWPAAESLVAQDFANLAAKGAAAGQRRVMTRSAEGMQGMDMMEIEVGKGN